MYQIDKIQFLQIGVQGENIATDIEIDMTSWANQFPDAVFHILFKPYNASTPSPMLTTYADGVLTWTVGVGATAVVGVGYTEIRAQDASTGLIKKSRIIPTSVDNSVSGVETTPPASYQEWVTDVLNAGTDAKNSAAAAMAYSQGKQIKFEIGDDDDPDGMAGHLLFYFKDEDDEDWEDYLDCGPVDVYAMAVATGYTGTKAQWVQSMNDAESNAQKAEKYAVGKVNGTDVGSTDPTYHNNSKYYSEQASGSATDANAAKVAAQAAQSAAETAAQTNLVEWLEQNITNPDSPPLDRTLSSSSSATPADITGEIKSAVEIIPVSVLENVGITTVNTSYGKLTSNTGYDTSVFEIGGYNEVVVKRPASTTVYFLVSDTLYTTLDIPTGNIASVNQNGKSYKYTNPNHRKYLYLMTKSTTPSYSASVSINIPNELTKDAEKLSDLKAETTVLNTLKSLYDNHGTTFFPVAYINNAEVANNGNYGKISSVTGSKVAVYKLSKDLAYYIKRYNAVGGIFLVSNTLYEQPTNAYITKITMSGQDAEYTFTNTNDYEYLYITAVLASNANYYSVITLDATNIVNKIYNDACMIPEFPQNIVCTYKHMYVANVNGVLKFSNDKLKTFSKTLDVSSYGLIKTYHLFENGCIAFFTHNKAYYSEDWTTVHEASVYESDGTTPYAMSTYDNFTNSKEDSNRKFVNGQDLFVFGNYGITDEENTRRIIWGSFDNGHSYKVLYEFNISGAYTIRHVHTVIYNPNFDKYICACGDTPNEARVLQFEISGSSMTNLTELGRGISHYMWAAVAFYGEDVYYCLENSPSAVVRVKFTEIDDPTKHQNILENLPNYPIGVFIGDHGDMLVTLTRYRASDSYSPIEEKYDARKIYYSEDREHFHEIIVPDIPTRAEDVYIYYGFYSPNADGKVLSGIFDNTTGGLADWTKMPSVALDDLVKKAGFPNAFKAIDPNREIIPVLSMVCGENYTVVEDQKIDVPTVTFYPWNASVKEYDIYEYDDSRIRITDDGTKILGYQPGKTTVKIRAKSNWNVTAEFTVTVTPAT